MRARAATLMDVANRAGVSKATVARVLSENGYVGAETREKVEAAVSAVQYRPNVLARGLRSQRSFTVAHVLIEITQNPFFAHVARAVESEALDNGYKTFLFNHYKDSEQERFGVERFIERKVDAVIFTYPTDPENVRLLQRSGVPVVQIERQQTSDTHAVLVDNPAGVREGVSHLIELGHRRIAFIGADPSMFPHPGVRSRSLEEERLDTYYETLGNAGLPADPDLVRLGDYYLFDDGSNVEGYRHMNALLALSDRPTAIFISCDILAAGVLRALYEANLRVPDDMSIVGFDDTLAAHLTPRLTTVAQPMTEMGSTAFQLAFSSIEDSYVEPRIVTLSPKLVVRDSTGPVPRMR